MFRDLDSLIIEEYTSAAEKIYSIGGLMDSHQIWRSL
jgi:hypothetical protein